MTTKPLLVILILAFVLTGCVTIDVNHKINSDGTSSIEVIYNMSGMYASLAGMGEAMGGSEVPFEDSCQGVDFSNSIIIDGICETRDGYLMVLKGKLPASALVGFEETATGYNYDIRSIYSVLNSLNSASASATSGESDDISDEFLSDANNKMMLSAFTYTIEMPTKIVDATIGTMKGKKVTIDMYELPDVESAFIESESAGSGSFALDNQMMIIIGIVIIVIIIVILLLVIKKKGPKKMKSVKGQETLGAVLEEPLSPTVKTLIQWIKTYESQYNEEALRASLTKNGYGKEDIEKAFQNK
ncbi:hypothetical protein H8D36_05130 [archaeon]|nr:hypothetical protein [archaeon]MBL7056780.1 hypothetical protein [Candidatus Woesearchaeota archaeon]